MTSLPAPAQFAAVYNDVTRFPGILDVCRELSLSERTIRRYAAAMRVRYMAEDPDAVALVERLRGKPPGSIRETICPSQAEEQPPHTIETVLPAYVEPIQELIARATAFNDRYADYNRAKAVVDIKVNFPGPYGVVGLPDHHLNNIGTNLGRALADAELIANHPHLFAIGIGDWLDNFIVGRLERERRKDIMSHSDAWRLLEHYVTILAPKLIAAISGNHMDWSTEAGGVDVMKRMFTELGLGAIYDTDEVRVRLTSPGGAQFTHLARHKYKGNSRFNSMHAIMVHILERWQGEDAIWGGHIHQAGHASIQKEWLGESRVVHGIQLGAYKQIDGYAKREHFRPNQPFLTPVTIHDPANGKTIFFEDVADGVRYLDLLRAERDYLRVKR